MTKASRALFILLAIVIGSCKSPIFAPQNTPVPTPQCVEPTLRLGDLNYKIEPVSRENNSFPDIPSGKKNMAYWVENTTVNYVFALSPTRDNLELNTAIKAGDPAVISWADCSQDEYVVQSIETIPARDLNVFDQSSGGITIYVPAEDSTLVVHGGRQVTQPEETDIPVPTSEFQVDVRLLNPPPSEAGTVTVALEVTNRGNQAITMDEEDISLTMGADPEIFPVSVDPALPREIQPGFPLTVFVTFPKPEANSAVLRIFDITFDYYIQ